MRIDYERVEELARAQGTEEEIAACLGLSLAAFRYLYGRRKKLREVIRRGREAGRMALRAAQFEAALGGNAQLLVFLGKQYLSQRERGKEEEGEEVAPQIELVRAYGRDGGESELSDED